MFGRHGFDRVRASKFLDQILNAISNTKPYLEAVDYMALMALLLKETKSRQLNCEHINLKPSRAINP